MHDYLVVAIVSFLVVRSLYKTFIEPGWMKSQTRKIWKGKKP